MKRNEARLVDEAEKIDWNSLSSDRAVLAISGAASGVGSFDSVESDRFDEQGKGNVCCCGTDDDKGVI